MPAALGAQCGTSVQHGTAIGAPPPGLPVRRTAVLARSGSVLSKQSSIRLFERSSAPRLMYKGPASIADSELFCRISESRRGTVETASCRRERSSGATNQVAGTTIVPWPPMALWQKSSVLSCRNPAKARGAISEIMLLRMVRASRACCPNTLVVMLVRALLLRSSDTSDGRKARRLSPRASSFALLRDSVVRFGQLARSSALISVRPAIISSCSASCV